MIKKRIVGVAILLLVILLLSACDELIALSNNPPSDVQISILCGSNTVSITYTAGGSLNPDLPSYYALVLLQNVVDDDLLAGGFLGLAGYFPPEIPVDPLFIIPEMPSDPAGQRYTINIPIMGPNGSYVNDPWPDSTLYGVIIAYDLESESESDLGVGIYQNIACGMPVTPPASWWIQGMAGSTGTPGALGVIYAVSYGARGMGLHIYRIGMTNGQGTLGLEVTPEMLAAVPQFPSEYTIVARSEDGYMELAKLPTGQYQVNVGPDAEGKIHVVVFDEVRTGSPWFFFTVSIYGVP